MKNMLEYSSVMLANNSNKRVMTKHRSVLIERRMSSSSLELQQTGSNNPAINSDFNI